MVFVKYYINLERSDERRKLFEKNFPESLRIEAYDGLKLDSYRGIVLPEKTVSTNAELACSLSHLKCIMVAFKNKLKQVMIMEDDIINSYEKHWKVSLEDIFKNRPEGCHCLILNSNNKFVYEFEEEYIKWKLGFWGTACYILDEEGIRILYEKYIEDNFTLNLNNYKTSLYHQADFGILYEFVNAYNYTTPLFKFLDTENFIRDWRHLEDSKINKICDDYYKTT